MKKKIWLFVLAAALIIAGGISQWASSHYVVPILMYHHVQDIASPRSDTVSPRRFEWQMAYLQRHHFNVLSLRTLVHMIREGKPLPRRSVVITFDDGNADNYQNAFPVLKKYGFPATIFVITDVVNTPGYLTTPQMKEMLVHGIEIGSHTRGHPYLPGISGAELAEQIKDSKDRLERELGVPVLHFAYPAGGFTLEAKRIVVQSGYLSASTTNRGYDRFNRDLYELKRIRFSDQDNRFDYLWMKLSGFYNLFREPTSPF